MNETGNLHTIFQKFFPYRKRKIEIALDQSELETLSIEKKKSLAFEYLDKGEVLLRKSNLAAISYFEIVLQLEKDNFEIWLRLGKAFFYYGCQNEHEKGLLLASKCFKTSNSFNQRLFETRLYWGKALLQLGKISSECHYFLEAKLKFQEALSLCENFPTEALAQNYWDLGLVWTHIAEYSGEALDVRTAVQAYRNSLNYQSNPPSEFWINFGQAYFQMGLLINDNRLYLQAIEHFKKALKEDKVWAFLATTYTQLYINTVDERYFAEANECYMKITDLDEERLLRWSQLLGESGKINRDPKKLKIAIDKCIQAYPHSSQPTKILRGSCKTPHQRKNGVFEVSCEDDQESPVPRRRWPAQEGSRGAGDANDLKRTFLRGEEFCNSLLGQWIESLSLWGAYTGHLDAIVEAEDKILTATDQNPEDADLWYAYGICLSAYAIYYDDPNFYDLAIEKLQHGLSLDRTSAELWHALGVFHSQIGTMIDDAEPLKRSIKFFTRAIDLKPCCPTIIFDYASALLKLADLTSDQKALENAIQHFEFILQNQKNSILYHPEWLFFYASALDLLGDSTEDETYYTRAIEVLLQVLLIDPDFPKIQFKIALAYTHLAELTSELDFFHRAINYFRLAAKDDEENEDIWLEWGLTLINLAHTTFDSISVGQLYLESEQKIIRSGQLGNQHAYYHLACLYSLTKRYKEAMNLIEKASTLGILPSLEEMLQDEWLEGLRGTENFSFFLTHWESKQKAPDDVL